MEQIREFRGRGKFILAGSPYKEWSSPAPPLVD